MFGRLRTEWRLKTGLTFGLLSYWAVIYYGVHVVSPFAVREFDLSAVDRWVNFQPAWVWGYVTIYPFVAVVPWLAVERGDLWRYTFSMVFVIFVDFRLKGSIHISQKMFHHKNHNSLLYYSQSSSHQYLYYFSSI